MITFIFLVVLILLLVAAGFLALLSVLNGGDGFAELLAIIFVLIALTACIEKAYNVARELDGKPVSTEKQE